MFDNSKILRLSKKLLVGIHTRSKHLGSLRPHLTHLLSHLAGSCASCQQRHKQVNRKEKREGSGNPPLSLPRRKLKTDWSPNMHKKYQLILDIHLGSMSLVATPAWSMLLNLIVRGKGSFTVATCISCCSGSHEVGWTY